MAPKIILCIPKVVSFIETKKQEGGSFLVHTDNGFGVAHFIFEFPMEHLRGDPQ